MLRYGSVCSGIEAATLAWHGLGWHAAWFAEIDKFPAAVLAYHYPTVPNLGDMTTISRRVLTGEVEAPDILVGGTPCQAFSVAGLREGLADARGQLTISYVRLADATDFIRRRRGEPESVIVWENVPGVLSSKDNAFGCFLGALAGEDCELKPPGKRWADAGCVYGPQRAIAWRILDAQYFGLAQRRRRVFLVASARKGFDPAAVLFERDGVRRDSPPSREAGKDVACSIAGGARKRGVYSCDDIPLTAGTLRAEGGGADVDHARANHLIPSTGDISHCLNAGGMGRQDYETETVIVEAGYSASGDGYWREDIGPLRAREQDSHENLAVCVTGDITHTLKADGFDGSEDGTGRGTPIVVHGTQDPIVQFDHAHALGRNSGQENAVCYSIQAGALRENPNSGPDGIGIQETVAYTIEGRAEVQAVAFHENQRAEITMNDTVGALNSGGGKPDQGYPAVIRGMAVRRLMPIECERLQGEPEGYTAIPWRGGVVAPDGPRYKAIGNSKAVPCVSWLGQRIQIELDRKPPK